MASKFRGDDDYQTTPAASSQIIGIGQDWRNDSARTAATWYHNNSSKAIQIYAYHVSAGVQIWIGPSTTNYVIHRTGTRDSSILECPVQPIVPAGHYWYVTHVDHASSSQYQNILD